MYDVLVFSSLVGREAALLSCPIGFLVGEHRGFRHTCLPMDFVVSEDFSVSDSSQSIVHHAR